MTRHSADAVLRFVRLALPAEVGGVGPEAGQQGDQAVKASAGFAPRMQQQYRLRAGVVIRWDAPARPAVVWPDFPRTSLAQQQP